MIKNRVDILWIYPIYYSGDIIMEVHIGIKEATYPDGTKLSDVAKWNNYGSETIPPRPVFRIAAENILSGEKFKKRMKAYLHNVVVYENNSPGDLIEIEKKLLTTIGQQVVKEAKNIIAAGDELQENAPATIAKKKFNKPLYETGLLLKNIAHEVTE